MNKDELKTRFLNEFNNVFDKDGNIKNCGRESCLALISKAEALKPDTYFGNMMTGFMNAENIKKLHDELI